MFNVITMLRKHLDVTDLYGVISTGKISTQNLQY